MEESGTVLKNVEVIQWPPWVHFGDLISHGSTGMVLGLDIVFKLPPHQKEQHFVDRERDVYERLANGHDCILRYFGPLHNGILLQRAKYLQIRAILRDPEVESPSLELRVRWIRQVVAAVVFVHAQGIVHCDISCNNIFIDENWNAKLGDFGGSAIDGSEPLVCYETSHQHPREEDPSVRTELFALGSTIYEMLHGFPPHYPMDHHEIEQAYEDGRYPEVQSLPVFGDIVTKCWTDGYDTAQELLTEIGAQATTATEKSPSRSLAASILERCNMLIVPVPISPLAFCIASLAPFLVYHGLKRFGRG